MIIANSIGAFFAMHALSDMPIERASFIYYDELPITHKNSILCPKMYLLPIVVRQKSILLVSYRFLF